MANLKKSNNTRTFTDGLLCKISKINFPCMRKYFDDISHQIFIKIVLNRVLTKSIQALVRSEILTPIDLSQTLKGQCTKNSFKL